MAQLKQTMTLTGRGIALRLFAVLLLATAVAPAAHAQAVDCSDYPGGIIDGNVEAVSPSNINVDRNCTLRNWPQSNPLTANISFFNDGGSGGGNRLLLVFDNVRNDPHAPGAYGARITYDIPVGETRESVLEEIDKTIKVSSDQEA
jgi:hypothetical protein